MSNILPTAIPQYESLAKHAEHIRRLGKRVVTDVIEIGKRLTECRNHPDMKHGDWLSWLEREFGWTDRTALNFMRVYELSLKSETVSDLALPMRSLYRLAAPSTPEAACKEVFERAKKGERLNDKQVKAIVGETKPLASPPASAPVGNDIDPAQSAAERMAEAAEVAKAPAEPENGSTEKGPAAPADPAAEEPQLSAFKAAVAHLAALNRERSFKMSFGFREYDTEPAEKFVTAVSDADLEDAWDFLRGVSEAAENAEQRAKKAKQIAKEAKHPEKARAKAREEAIREAMEDDLKEAKSEAKESGERWADIGHDWITEWKQDHWSDEQEAEFNKEFCEKWQSDHGTPFPGAAPTTEQPLITTDDLRRLQEEAEAASDGPA
jgi:hypothetical protein